VARFPEAVNGQIANEFAASQQYIAIAVYYDAETLPQLAAHFYRQAVEERNHALMLVQYLLDAGEAVDIPGVTVPKTSFADAAEPVSLALEQEKTVTQQIAGLVELARAENDFVGEEFLHWFLKEQREEVSSMSALLAVVKRAGDSLLLVEDFLSRNAVGDQGAPDADAPAAAGGAL
jgi:ferritin